MSGPEQENPWGKNPATAAFGMNQTSHGDELSLVCCVPTNGALSHDMASVTDDVRQRAATKKRFC